VGAQLVRERQVGAEDRIVAADVDPDRDDRHVEEHDELAIQPTAARHHEDLAQVAVPAGPRQREVDDRRAARAPVAPTDVPCRDERRHDDRCGEGDDHDAPHAGTVRGSGSGAVQGAAGRDASAVSSSPMRWCATERCRIG
jgi:hypothetical protein